jgi:hypothetical protein
MSEIVKSLKVATPDVEVVTDVVPPKIAGPDAFVAVTV